MSLVANPITIRVAQVYNFNPRVRFSPYRRFLNTYGLLKVTVHVGKNQNSKFRSNYFFCDSSRAVLYSANAQREMGDFLQMPAEK